jgi:hypothetical protein
LIKALFCAHTNEVNNNKMKVNDFFIASELENEFNPFTYINEKKEGPIEMGP